MKLYSFMHIIETIQKVRFFILCEYNFYIFVGDFGYDSESNCCNKLIQHNYYYYYYDSKSSNWRSLLR